MASMKSRMMSGFIWRLLQHVGVQIISFVVSIVLARILTPDDYGVVAMVTVFTTIALVFVNTGFSSAIIQKKDLTEDDKNTAFYSGLILALVIYAILFFGAPLIAQMYNEPQLVDLVRVMGLIVVIGALYSVQQALIRRKLQFKKSLIIALFGIVTQGAVGIVLANKGFGPWALVYGSVANYAVCAVIAWCVERWYPKFTFSKASFKSMFFFSLKMLLSDLLNSVFNNIRSLIIGVKYSSDNLAYYKRGYEMPSLVMVAVDSSINDVLFPSLSKYQNDWKNGIRVLRRSMKIAMYVCAPLMFGMVAVAEPFILLLLTEKWAGSIIYVRLGAMICLFWPLSARTHALNALGKTGISLVLNIIGKVITLAILLVTTLCFDSVEAIVIGSIIGSIIALIINAPIFARTIDYKIRHQIMDVLPALLLSAFMCICTYFVGEVLMGAGVGYFLTLVIQVICGALVYILGSIIFKFESFKYLLNIIKSMLSKLKKKKSATVVVENQEVDEKDM